MPCVFAMLQRAAMFVETGCNVCFQMSMQVEETLAGKVKITLQLHRVVKLFVISYTAHVILFR